MLNLDILIVYSIVAFFYIISPGPAIFLAISNGMTQSMKVVAISSFANIVALFLLSTISISGIGAILIASSGLFLVVKIIGACYLIYLGVKQFQNAKSLNISKLVKQDKKVKGSWAFFLEAFLLAFTNPKPIIFFMALFPQFLDSNVALIPQFFLLTAIFMFFSFFSLFTYGLVAKSSKKLFSNHNRMQWFHRFTGGIFISMGVVLLQLKNS